MDTKIESLKLALQLLQEDNHYWSTRPCSTCQTISKILEKPFGCLEYKRRHDNKEDTTKLVVCSSCGKSIGSYPTMREAKLYCDLCVRRGLIPPI
jgi:hypothetical protein